VGRYDWLLLLDPVPPADPSCWRSQAGLALLSGEGEGPLAVGHRLRSPGLELEALAPDSPSLGLAIGRWRWLLLPDRQALASLPPQAARPAPAALWLGFTPRQAERRRIQALQAPTVWQSGAAPRALEAREGIAGAPALPRGWHATGGSGSLAWSRG
jgi:competence protein ComEC